MTPQGFISVYGGGLIACGILVGTWLVMSRLEGIIF
jgi:hypothetical protein